MTASPVFLWGRIRGLLARPDPARTVAHERGDPVFAAFGYLCLAVLLFDRGLRRYASGSRFTTSW